MARWASLALVWAAASSCKEAQLKISIVDPNGLRESAQWTEFDIFSGECPDKYVLADGEYPAPVRSQIIDDLGGEAFEAVGSLEAKKYGFAVLLRDPSCAIIGYGCATADLATVREIVININYTYASVDTGDLEPRGACVEPQACERGRCTEPEEP